MNPRAATTSKREINTIENEKMLSYNNLPEDVMEDIIVMLPVKSLLRFKCVSKSWHALITNRSFMDKHFELSNSITKNRGLKLMFYPYRRSNLNPPCISLFSIRDQPSKIQNLELPFPNKDDLKWMIVLGQCHGIIFLCGHYESFRRLILWNPSTKEVKPIPDSEWQPKAIYWTSNGFGYDRITKDYKAIRFLFCPFGQNKEEQPRVEVYNLSTNSWRKLDVADVDVPVAVFGLRHAAMGPYLNGVHYWLARDTHEFNKFIVSFDFSTEAFGIIQSPPGIASSLTPENLISVMDESLVWVVAHHSIELRVEIWVLNDEYDVDGSIWIKKLEIQPFPMSFYILGFLGEDDMLILYDIPNKFFSYNFRRRGRLQQNHFPGMPIMDYVESLVPLGAKGELHKRL